jgi:hypothetical protein
MKPGVVTVIALALGGLVLYGLGKWDGVVSARDRVIVQEARAVLKAGAGYRARIGALRDSVAGLEASERRLVGLAGRQRAQLDSLLSVEGVATSGPVDSLAASLGMFHVKQVGWVSDSGTVRHLALLAWRAEVRLPATEALLALTDSLLRVNRQLVETWAVRAGLAEARVTVLEASLTDVLTVADCRFLFWRCPSRTVTFVVGLAVGAVGATVAQ